MSDARFESLTVKESAQKFGKSVRIEKIRLSNYKFFYGDFELPVNGKNLLLYGENGSGKSSIYEALKLLAKDNFSDFDNDKNIFAQRNDEASVEFVFNNEQELIITSDLEEIPDYMPIIAGLSVFKPMLDYKKLLRVHYASEGAQGRINLYHMFRSLLYSYPVKRNGEEAILSEIEDLLEYFKLLETTLDSNFTKEINRYLKDYFQADFKIEKFEYKTKIDKNDSTVTPIINAIVDYKEHLVYKYHTFLNEARLSALAISIYLFAIKKLIDVLDEDSLKILVLDDLLISLDMSNRLKVLTVLKSEFADFQIFFFTHDKELYEIYKNKMDWMKYELYLDDTDEIPVCILKEGKSEIERAKVFYAQKDYDACALLLRKGFEKIIKNFLTPKERRNTNCVELDLSGLISRAISKCDEPAKSILEKLNSDRQHILNPLCHFTTKNIYSEELKNAIVDLEKLKVNLK